MLLKKEKIRIVGEIKKLAEEYEVIGILNIHKLPAKQFQAIRNSIRNTAKIRVIKKSLVKRALEESLVEKLKDEPALIFSNENPFRLFKIIKQNRSPAQAKAGDIAKNDIIIRKGPTSQPPGPAISTFQKIGLKTTVESGKIAIAKDTVVVREGQEITPDHVNVFSLMKMEPMEIGLEIIGLTEGGVYYEKNIMDVSTGDYLNQIKQSISQMANISLNTGYLVPETAPLAVQKAFIKARQLAVDACLIDKSFIDDILRKASLQAIQLEEKMSS